MAFGFLSIGAGGAFFLFVSVACQEIKKRFPSRKLCAPAITIVSLAASKLCAMFSWIVKNVTLYNDLGLHYYLGYIFRNTQYSHRTFKK